MLSFVSAIADKLLAGSGKEVPSHQSPRTAIQKKKLFLKDQIDQIRSKPTDNATTLCTFRHNATRVEKIVVRCVPSIVYQVSKNLNMRCTLQKS